MLVYDHDTTLHLCVGLGSWGQSVTMWKGNCKGSQEIWLEIKLLPLNSQTYTNHLIFWGLKFSHLKNGGGVKFNLISEL